MSFRAFRSHPQQVVPLLHELAHRGAIITLTPPEFGITFAAAPTADETRILEEMRPYVFEYLLACGRAAGRFFCDECATECTDFGDAHPKRGAAIICGPCLRGHLSFARLQRVMRHTPYWTGDN